MRAPYSHCVEGRFSETRGHVTRSPAAGLRGTLKQSHAWLLVEYRSVKRPDRAKFYRRSRRLARPEGLLRRRETGEATPCLFHHGHNRRQGFRRAAPCLTPRQVGDVRGVPGEGLSGAGEDDLRDLAS